MVTLIASALINAAAFIGFSEIAKAAHGTHKDEERIRHDLAIEKFQHDHNEYVEKREKLYDRMKTTSQIKAQAKQNFTDTDYALKLYNKVHQDKIVLKEPKFEDYYKPSDTRKKTELVYLVVGALLSGIIISKLL